MTPDATRRVVAYHEAGHAVYAIVKRVPFARMSLAPEAEPPTGTIDLTPTANTLTDPHTSVPARRDLARRLFDVCLAGSEAEWFVTDQPGLVQPCATCAMTATAHTMAGRRSAPDPTQARRLACRLLLRRRAADVHVVAAALLARGTLTSDEVRELVRHANTSMAAALGDHSDPRSEPND